MQEVVEIEFWGQAGGLKKANCFHITYISFLKQFIQPIKTPAFIYTKNN